MGTDDLPHDEDVLELVMTAPEDVGLELVDEAAEPTETLASPTTGGQTGSVKFYNVSCAGGAVSQFAVPINAPNWHLRFGFFRADGARLGLSTILDWDRSYYPPSVLSGRLNGPLPSGTRDLRAFWWYGHKEDGTSGPVWWNRIGVNC